MFQISARIWGGFGDPDVICAFDPTKVVKRLERLFPEIEIHPRDLAWRDYDLFRQQGMTDESRGALSMAATDARRRGTIWSFRIPTPTGGWVRGKAERHHVVFYDEYPFQEPLMSQLMEFVESLRFASCVTIEYGPDDD